MYRLSMKIIFFGFLVALFACVGFLPGLCFSGQLEPGTAPGSTMHTLEDIYQKLVLMAGPPAPVMTTFQTTCYENDGTAIDCAGTGQDAEHQSGASFEDARFVDHGDGTVTDNLTGLMWTKDANLANGAGGFQWALDYVTGMNSGSNQNFGNTDWRVPNIRELMSLIDYENKQPVLSAGHPFTNVQGTHNNLYYHTSTSHAANHTHTYCVSFYHADVTGCNKYPDINDAFLWPVRGGN